MSVGQKAVAPYEGFLVYKIFHRQEGRFYACLVSGERRTTISWAKYVFETTTGKHVPKGMTVDHKDENRINDEFSNLQLLTNEDNVRKNFRLTRPAKFVTKICPCCSTPFQVAERNARFWGDRRRFHCSRKCARAMQSRPAAA
jgi:hypothetical protein